jgi:hypothetical protein
MYMSYLENFGERPSLPQPTEAQRHRADLLYRYVFNNSAHYPIPYDVSRNFQVRDGSCFIPTEGSLGGDHFGKPKNCPAELRDEGIGPKQALTELMDLTYVCQLPYTVVWTDHGTLVTK